MMVLKSGIILFLCLFLACDQTRDFVAIYVESLDKEDLKVLEDQNKKKQRNTHTISLRKNIYWDEENTFLNHFFAFKDNYLFFYNQNAGHLGWKSKGIRGETNATWISEIEWIAVFNKNLFLLGVGKDKISLYKKPFESSVFLLNSIPLKVNSPETNDNDDSLEDELLTVTASNQNFNLKQFNVILDATFKKDFIQILFSDYRLLNFSEENFQKIEWIKPSMKIFKKPKEERSYFYQMFLTEDPEMHYVTFKKYTLKGLESILVDYLNVKTEEVIKSLELKMGNRSFCAIENHRFITTDFIKSKEKYSFHYKSLKNDESFTRSISIPGALSPSHLKMEDKFITGYYIKDDKVDFFQWK